jgi:hypothetical protein
VGRYLELAQEALESCFGNSLPYEKNETNEKRVSEPARGPEKGGVARPV